MHVRISSLIAALAFSLATLAHAKPTAPPSFDREAASRALGGIELAKCKAPGGPRGEGHVIVTFQPEGVVTDVVVDRAPYQGNPVARCLVAQYKQARVPAFGGAPVIVGKTFRID